MGRGRSTGNSGVLPRSFYVRPTLDVFTDLIGKVLVRDHPDGTTAGVIVEVEAYVGESDPACHAAPGPTPRNAPLYGPPGFAYVYLNYGIHELANVVTEPEGSPAAVLIRALDPIDGVELMRQRRMARRPVTAGAIRDAELCRGPGNLTVAMAIDRTLNRADLVSGPLRIEDRGIVPASLAYTPRIGIRVGVDRPWRCVWTGHAAVSGPMMTAVSGPRPGRSARSAGRFP